MLSSCRPSRGTTPKVVIYLVLNATQQDDLRSQLKTALPQVVSPAQDAGIAGMRFFSLTPYTGTAWTLPGA